MRAWLIVQPHPAPAHRRRILRAGPGGPRVSIRVRVHRVEVLERLDILGMARVRFRSGALMVETWKPFCRLATTRERFRDRLESLNLEFSEPAAA